MVNGQSNGGMINGQSILLILQILIPTNSIYFVPKHVGTAPKGLLLIMLMLINDWTSRDPR